MELFMDVPSGTVVSAMLRPALETLLMDGLVRFVLILVDRPVFPVVAHMSIVFATVRDRGSGGE